MTSPINVLPSDLVTIAAVSRWNSADGDLASFYLGGESPDGIEVILGLLLSIIQRRCIDRLSKDNNHVPRVPSFHLQAHHDFPDNNC